MSYESPSPIPNPISKLGYNKTMLVLFGVLFLVGIAFVFITMFNDKDVKVQRLEYSILYENKKTGTLNYDFKYSNNGLTIIESKSYSADFLNDLNKAVKSERVYEIDKDFSIIKYSEKEYIGKKLHLIKSQVRNEHDDYIGMITVIKQVMSNGKIKPVLNKTCILPVGSKIYVNSMKELMFLLDEPSIELNNYYLYTDSEGFIGYNHIESEEPINSKAFGKRPAFKIVTIDPIKVVYWIDKDTRTVVRKDEYVTDKSVITTVLDGIHYREEGIDS